MAKKRRKKKYPQTRELPYRMPPLGWKDHLLYSFLMLFFVALAIAVFPLRGWITHTFFAVEGEYVAENSRGAGGLVAFPAMLLFILALSILIPYNGFRYPVFGRKDVEYGPPRYEPIHPLLARDKPAYRRTVTKKEEAGNKKIRRILIACLVGIILFNVSMFVLSLGHGVFFRPDGSIDDYGIFNRECRTYVPEDMLRVKLTISDPTIPLPKHTGSTAWTYGMRLYTKDGEEYLLEGFEGGQTQKLNALLAYKEIYGPLVTMSDDWRLGYLDSVAEDQNMTPEEEALLYELFDRVP